MKPSKKGKFFYSDEEELKEDSPSGCVSTQPKKFKTHDVPGVISMKVKEKPLPHPFPFPANYRHDVEVCLKSCKMTASARKHFLSAIASVMFSYKK